MLLLFLILLSGSPQAGPEAEQKAADRILVSIPDEVSGDRDILFRSDGSAALWTGKAHSTGRIAMWTNDKKGEEYDHIQFPVLSGDEKVLAFVAINGLKRFVVAGGRQEPAMEGITRPVLNQDGSVVAYRANAGLGEVMVVNGKAGEAFEKVHSPIFHPVSSEVCYVAQAGGKAFVVCGTDKVGTHDEAWFPAFSRDGKHLAYGAKEARHQFVVIDRKRGKEYDEVSAPKFAPDDRTVVYSARIGEKWVVVLGEKESAPWDYADCPVVGPQGDLLAWIIGPKGNSRVLFKGKESPAFDSFYAMWTDLNGRYFTEPAVSANHVGFAYRGKRGQKWHVYDGTTVGEPYDAIGRPVLSPDGAVVAYVASLQHSAHVIVGNRRWGPFTFAGPAVFSGNQAVSFGVLDGRELRWKTIPLQ